MNSICLIIPYFGPFPNYFQLWLESVRKNPDIDFCIITDQKLQIDIPDNVTIVETTFNELRERIQELYDFKISLKKPYKICDFRPAYGEIFNNIIDKYDFWGYCDVDLIFGNIKEFITDAVLNEYERINLHGHLSIYKNSEKMNTLYKKEYSNIMDYKLAFSTNQSCHFDEYPGISLICKYENIKYIDIEEYADIDRFSYKFKKIYDHSQKKNDEDSIIQIFKWDNGKLTNIIKRDEKICENEIMYVHLQKRHMENRIQKDIDSFFIVPNIFLDDKEDTVLQRIDEYAVDKKNGEKRKFVLGCFKQKFQIDYWKVKWNMRKRVKG